MDITELGDPTVARPSKLADPLYYSSVRALAAARKGSVKSMTGVSSYSAMEKGLLLAEAV